MGQTNKQVADRFAPAAVKGGNQERKTAFLCGHFIAAGQDVEAILPDGTDKTNFMNAMDTALTAIHSGTSKLAN